MCNSDWRSDVCSSDLKRVDVSWFKPMKYIGIWWGMIRGDWSWAEGPKHGATTERTKQYIDFAAKHGFGGVLVEGWNKGWNGNWFGHGAEFSFTQATADFDLKAVTDYGREKGVQLTGHHETGGKHGTTGKTRGGERVGR